MGAVAKRQSFPLEDGKRIEVMGSLPATTKSVAKPNNRKRSSSRDSNKAEAGDKKIEQNWADSYGKSHSRSRHLQFQLPSS
jgi:hypothetical protein